MTKQQDQVKQFMLQAEQLCPVKPAIPELDVRILRVKLIAEELCELADAYGLHLFVNSQMNYVDCRPIPGRASYDLADTVDATCDLLVVVEGNGVALGVDLEPCSEEVHRSNMTKFIDGYKRADGKWVKGKSYSPANLKPILEAQCS